MHEHVLAISSKQLNHLIEARNDFVGSGGLHFKGREHEDGAITIQLALFNTKPKGNSIIIQKAYEHTASFTKISKKHYEDLFNRGLLDDRYSALDTVKLGRRERDSAQNAKKVDVYAIRFLLTPKAKSARSQGQQSQDTPAPDDSDASDSDARGAIKKGQFDYTVMCKTPPGCVAVKYQSSAVAQRQALGNRDAEIDVASFIDIAPLRHFEKKAFQRRFSIGTDVRGRWRKPKAVKRKMLFGRDLLVFELSSIVFSV
ncbi:MAG: hypothetical protein Q9161_003150 [Pseudevernia consocians]